MRPHVPNEQLTPEQVPAPGAPWSAVSEFGHRFHAYRVAGSVQRVATITVQAHDAYTTQGRLPDDLTTLRVCLFHTVRAVGLDGTPDADTDAWARALLDEVRSRVG